MHGLKSGPRASGPVFCRGFCARGFTWSSRPPPRSDEPAKSGECLRSPPPDGFPNRSEFPGRGQTATGGELERVRLEGSPENIMLPERPQGPLQLMKQSGASAIPRSVHLDPAFLRVPILLDRNASRVKNLLGCRGPQRGQQTAGGAASTGQSLPSIQEWIRQFVTPRAQR